MKQEKQAVIVSQHSHASHQTSTLVTEMSLPCHNNHTIPSYHAAQNRKEDNHVQ
ncbi:hypothetical protein [Mariprofundus aestuarium]|uniref:hypothetical protein n=1 Tax=Mariprofundus aestuarium TaxID=1921086 RepID=UPI0012FD846A|nr:hypothetical protein [Mariprofundus aestuarium]